MCNYIYSDLHLFMANDPCNYRVYRGLTYFGSIFNEIIIYILDVGTRYGLFGLICQKGKIYRYLWIVFLMLWTLWVWSVRKAYWTKYEKCKEVIQDIWNIFSSIQSTIVLVEGLKICEDGLTRWSWIDVSYYPRKIQEKRKTLQALVQKNGMAVGD